MVMNRLEKRRVYADPACDKCDGQGMYLHPDTGGAIFCDCHTKQKVRAMTTKASLPPKNTGCTVTSYVPTTDKEQALKQFVIDWVKAYEPYCKGVFLFGKPGTGKTHMASALCNALIKQHGVQPLYVSATELAAKAKARIGQDNFDADPFEVAADAEVLVLDDFGSEKPSEWLLAQFSELVDRRYRNNMTTIVTSNLTMQTVEDLYGSRIADRLWEMCSIFHCDGKSRRRA